MKTIDEYDKDFLFGGLFIVIGVAFILLCI